jgi:hypothetical protein
MHWDPEPETLPLPSSRLGVFAVLWRFMGRRRPFLSFLTPHPVVAQINMPQPIDVLPKRRFQIGCIVVDR